MSTFSNVALAWIVLNRSMVVAALLPCTALFLPTMANAQSPAQVEQLREGCRNSVGRPGFDACIAPYRNSPDFAQKRLGCFAAGSARVTACLKAAMQKNFARPNVAVAIDDGRTAKEAVNVANALPTGFIPPPRSIADISAILDREKPDSATLRKRQNDAEGEPEKGLSVPDLAEFYYDRAQARGLLGQYAAAIADAEKGAAIAATGADPELKLRLKQLIGGQQRQIGDVKASISTFRQMLRETVAVGKPGWALVLGRNIIETLLLSGDIQQAEGYLRRTQATITERRTNAFPGARTSYARYGRAYEADFEASRAYLFEARGQYRDAEIAYKRAADYLRAWIPNLNTIDYPPPESQVRTFLDAHLLKVALMKAKQGRLAEAEVDARAVLLARLKEHGKYHPLTPQYVLGLAGILIEQGRYADAERLIRSALEIQRTIGIKDETQHSAQIISQLGAVLTFQRKVPEAAASYSELDKAIANWEPARKQVLELNGSRIAALYASGQIEAGVATAQEALKRELSRFGDGHFDTAAARGTLAIGYALGGRDAEAVREFRASIPILLAASRENVDDDDDTISAARTQRLQDIVETYIGLLAKTSKDAFHQASLESFALADAIRGQSVQKALSASSARGLAKDPALAGLVRKEQDFGKQLNAQLGALNNALASNVRDENVVKATRAAADKVRNERLRVREEINKRFPSYAELIDPRPPTVEQVQQVLAQDETMLSFYFGRNGSFVWAVPREGQVVFASINATAGDIENKVNKLREALEPNAAMISDIPPFDLTLGFDLYSLLLKPVEAGWKHSKSLIVVTNGALGLLPLSVLPTMSTPALPSADLLFASYRNVPWLARTHAVSMLPSSAALRTLRNLPPGKPGRGELMAFGDPYFSKKQHEEAENTVQVTDVSTSASRGAPLKRRSSPKLDVDSAELALLPRLPDTAEELKSIALALQADPSKVLYLGKDANEGNVKSMDLSGFKVLAFATHGLVPGELNGLTQPALALSAPAVAGVEGDGLLTMEEILSLKLDADWVVLSACNTGAGSGAGAEAASGLGRAFFYAGTRALLVTNWSVHSQSARELITDLFKRQAADSKLARGAALREAMMAMVDGPGYKEAAGEAEFAYAHPLFWAPYTIIGDGGRR